jgi:hypothetical protein
MADMSFMDMFFETYLEFQRETRKSSITAFAKYLSKQNPYGVEFSQQLVSGWLNGDFSPSAKYAPALASIMGDRIYIELGLDRPDPDLQTLSRLWPRLPEETRHAIREQAEKYVTENAQPSEQLKPVEKTA